MAVKKLTKDVLVKAHDEINEVIGIEPPIDEALKSEKYEKELYKTVVELEISDKEVKGMTKDTQDVLKLLKEKYGEDEEAEEEAAEEVEETEEEEEEPAPKKTAKKPAPVPEKPAAKKTAKKPEPEPEEEEEEEEDEEEKPVAKKGTAKKEEKAPTKKGDGEKKKFTAAEFNRVDALAEVLLAKTPPKTVEEWAEKANEVLRKKGGTVQPNTRENKFTIGYFQKIAKHFDLGNVPMK